MSRLQQTPSSKPVHFYSSSGGNAGLACVTAARYLNLPATVIVPLSTKPMMIAKLRAAGATDVVQIGASWQEADDYLRNEVLAKLTEHEGIYVPPFDHEMIWEGVSTMVDEIKSQLSPGEKPDGIICSVGGGGLFCGVMRGLDRHGWGDVPVLAMETIGADSLSQSLKAGRLVTLPGITSIATSLGAVRVAEQAFKYGQRSNVKSVVFEDAEAAMGQWRLADDERLLVDTACAVSVAPCYDGRLHQLLPGLAPESKIVVIICGGNAVTVEEVMKYKEMFGGKFSGTKDEDVPSSHALPTLQ
ncbi:MAG: hypothetical protein Q9160_008762 [Pyrenula sp. 1 TL-2023]